MTTDAPALSRHEAASPWLMVRRAALHEFYAATEADAVPTTAAVLALTAGTSPHPVLWVRQNCMNREHGTPYPPGLREFGFDPARIIFVQAQDGQAVLQAGLEGARCAALAAVVIELWGSVRALDLTASRRLALAAKGSGTPVLMARGAAQPCASAAETRWHVRAAPSRALAAKAPGNPAISLSLLRHRGGLSQETWHLEWNRDTRSFDDRAAGPNALPRLDPFPPLHGAVVALPFDGQAALGDGRAAPRQAG